MQTSRRTFLIHSVAAIASATALENAMAQAPAKLDPNDAQAKALGYVADATTADKVKYPKYAAGQACGTCQLYTGKDAMGACPIFGGKLVSTKGWCSAYVKKA
jgi:hypothetical protein